MKKIIAILFAITILLSLSAFPVLASEAGAGSETVENASGTPESIAPEEEQGSKTQTAAAWLTEHFGDITGAISSIGLTVLAWFISKKLIPAVKDAIKNVAAKSAASESAFSDKVDGVVSFLENGVKHLEECEARLNETREELQKRIDANAKAYELQTDLINYLFLNLRIPNELKAEVAKRSEDVKNAIKDASKE